METVFVAFAVGLVGLVGCSSSSSSPGTAADAGAPPCASPVAGSYALLRKVDTSQPNTCMLKDDTTPSTVIIGADGALTFQNTAGTCHGTIDGCSLTAKCGGSTPNGGALTLTIGWTFGATGFTGSTLLDEDSPRCETTSADTGTRN